jgi:hypothetical protein
MYVSSGDTATASVSVVSRINTTEAGGTAVFSVVLDSQPYASVTIDAMSTDLGEGRVSSWSLTFAVGQWNVSQTVTVTGRDDVLVDGDIAYNITTAAVNSSDTNFNGASVADVVGVKNLDGMLHIYISHVPLWHNVKCFSCAVCTFYWIFVVQRVTQATRRLQR